MQFTEKQQREYNTQGFIPGPDETAEEFAQRVDFCLRLRETLSVELGEQIADGFIAEAVPITQKLFGIAPTWVPLIFSNRRISYWHGGCAWIFQLTPETPTAAFLQLRKAFMLSKRYIRLYDRDELIAHELAHVGRMKFTEPKFEEVLAYRTAKTALRRWFGPIIQSPAELLLFLFTLCVAIGGDLYLLFGNNKSVDIASILWLKTPPIALILLGGIRAWWRQKQLRRCLEKLKTLLNNEEHANAVLYRLQDNEIIDFGKMAPEALQDYVERQGSRSLRWAFIKKLYFPIYKGSECPCR
jgi:hypothetical protein